MLVRITDALLQHAKQHPQRLAVVVPGSHRYTYGMLAARMEQNALRLRSAQTQTGVTVPVLASTAWQYLIRFLTIVHAGCVAVGAPQNVHAPIALPLLSRIVAEPHGIFYMGLTSGSTGIPKGILRTHASWVNSFYLMTRLFGTPRRLLVPGALAFSAALIAALHALHEGGTVYLPPAKMVARLPDLMQQEAITHAFLVPARLRSMLDTYGNRQSDLNATLVTAGAKLDRETRERLHSQFPSAQLYEYYGSAEMGFVSYMAPDMGLSKYDSVGRLCPGVECELRDDLGASVPLATPGMIHVRSPYQFAGYADDDPVPTSGWVTAGDWGWFDEDGFLYLLGRPEEQINVGGAKIFSAEVEQALLAHPAVRDVAVVGLSDRLRGQVVVAGVVLRGDETVTSTGLRHWCRERLPSFAIPRRIRMLAALPRNPAGKVDRTRILETLNR
jgi:long-chain acyl-CoA synthetase